MLLKQKMKEEVIFYKKKKISGQGCWKIWQRGISSFPNGSSLFFICFDGLCLCSAICNMVVLFKEDMKLKFMWNGTEHVRVNVSLFKHCLSLWGLGQGKNLRSNIWFSSPLPSERRYFAGAIELLALIIIIIYSVIYFTQG